MFAHFFYLKDIKGRNAVNDQKIFDRREQGCFPKIKELKQLIRDIVNPDKDLGHSDKKMK
jgi:selenoprotein W-related protein